MAKIVGSRCSCMNFFLQFWSFVSNFGVGPGLTSQNIKRIRLSNQLLCVCVAFTVIYGGAYYYFGFYRATKVDAVAIVAYSGLLLLAGSRHANISKFLFVIVLNIHMFFLVLCFGTASQMQLLFIPVSAVPLVLFDFKAIKTIVAFILYSLSLFLLVFILDHVSFAETLSERNIGIAKIAFNLTAIMCELIIFYSFISNYDRAARSLDEDKLLLEHQLAVMFDNSFDGIFLVDAKSREIVKANRRAAELFDVEKESELYGEKGFSFHKRKLTDEDLRTIQLELISKGRYEDEVEYITKKGREFWGAIAVRMIHINGKPFQSVRISDITAQKKAEKHFQASITEKEILLAEIHHRVKNNLAVVSGLLGMQASYLEDENAKRLFQESRNRIHSMALIHDKLYQHENLAKINFCNYINDLVEHIRESYPSMETDINISSVCNDIFLDIKYAVPCGLILNELISNSCKHAFKGRSEGTIKIVCTKMGDKFTMSVSDNGTGFDLAAKEVRTQSLGLTLISALSDQVSGSVKFSCDNGTAYYLSFEV
ncbi:MAG: sensor histidine kinase [Bacteroidia bacterium]